jgi:interferon gamma-inducible protein 30
MLYPAFDKLRDTGILAVELYPYGNAHEKQLPDGSWHFDCQHGEQECLGNLLEVCVIAHLGWDSHRYLPVISCMEGADSPVLATKGCLAALAPALPYSAVKACAWGTEGNRLMHALANRTESLSPAHKYVPWIVVQGQHTEELEQQATTNLVGLVCSLYKGAKPTQCETQAAAASNFFIQRDWIEEKGAKSEAGDNTCILCKYVISTLDGMLEDKSNKKQIKAALETLCSLLPSAMEKQCDTFVETYTDLIIDLLTKDVSPEMVCSNLGLCPDTAF